MTESLTPMVVQYLVGLCCLRTPDAVEVTIGDMVLDVAARKERDVDVTVTVEEERGSIRAFKAYEVKRERRPLDVATVEQLGAKLLDMPRVTHRAIVSASGYTEAAMAKAAARGVELYVFRRWDAPAGAAMPHFKGESLPLVIHGVSRLLLHWKNASVFVYAPDAPTSFDWKPEDKVYSAAGPHSEYGTMREFRDLLFLRSTGILWKMQPIQKVLALWKHEEEAVMGEVQATPLGHHTHTLGVVEDQVFLDLASGLAQVHWVCISGELEWRLSHASLGFHIVERVPDGEPYAGAAIAEYGTPDGRMAALVFAPGSRTVGVHPVLPAERHLKAVRRLRLMCGGHAS